MSGRILGVELKGVESVPVGYMSVKEVFPLDIEEFSRCLGLSDEVLTSVAKAFEKRIPVDEVVHAALRIVGSIGLLFCSVAGWQFWTLYVFCGISDMIDGWLARKLQAESKTGSVLDSIADLSFVACCAIKLQPALSIISWLWIWAGIIVIIKIVNLVSSLIIFKKFYFFHTIANKLTGFLLFLTVPTISWCIIPIAIVAIIATFAAIQEGNYIGTRREII